MREILIACFLFAFAISGRGQGAQRLAEDGPIRGINASDIQIRDGLAEVLFAASRAAIKKAGAENGFLANDGIKIRLPDKLLNSEKGLRMMGQGLKIEEFGFTMNRIAEFAAPLAADVFSRAITAKNFNDLRSTLNGKGAAATEDLRRSAFPAMVKAFRPAVSATIRRTDAQQQFDWLAAQYTGLTLGDKCQIDLADYLSANILAGLFTLSGQEEENIRGNPQAQSKLLQMVLAVP